MRKKIKEYLHNPTTFILLSFISLFILYFSFVTFSRHDNFYSRRLDLGNMDQTVWNVLHGHGFTLTDPAGTQQESRLAVHADFLLIFLAPFYLIWSDPKMLLIIQTFILGLGALPVFWIAQDKLKSSRLALLFAAAFLLYPPLERMALHDFHAVAFSTTFLLFSYFFMIKKKYLPFLLFAILAGLGKEEVWLITGLMGLYIFWFNKKRWLGLTVAVLSFAAFYWLFWHLIPAATISKQHFALIYLSDFGDNQNKIIKDILTNPFLVIRTILQKDRLFYYFQLLSPTGLFSLLSPFKLIFAGPDLLINSLSNNWLMRQIDYQYNSNIAPFIFVTSIEGFAALSTLIRKIKNKKYVAVGIKIAITLLLISTIATSYLWGELPGELQSRFMTFTSTQPEKKLMNKVISRIDINSTVSVTNDIGAHLSQRQFLYNYPVNAQKADYTLVQLGDPYAWPSDEEQKKTLQILLKDDNYDLIAQSGMFYAFKRKVK